MERPAASSATQINDFSETLHLFAGRGQTALLPALLAAQNTYGYVPEAVAAEIGKQLGVPLAELSGVIEFYDLLSQDPTAETVLRFCNGAMCVQAGSRQQMAEVARRLGVAPGESSPDGAYLVQEIPCLGLCDHAPAALAGGELVAEVAAQDLERWLPAKPGSPGYRLQGQPGPLTARIGKNDPLDLSAYRAAGGFSGLERALTLPAEEVIQMVSQAGLVGRGGAAFPAGIKWDGARQASAEPKYIVVNADESELGTFKDRVLMEFDPYSTLEGMLIAAYAVGASRGYIYVRGEYQHAQRVLQAAIEHCREAGYLGAPAAETGMSFEVEIRSGAGAYICGEETALFESIEGKRGFPRIKPPFPTTHGLFGKPTVINNVETLCNVPLILREGAAAYRQRGTEKSPGTKLFCLSGDLQRTGLVETPFGLTLRELLYEFGGGPQAGREIQAVLIGGAAGVFITPDELDVRLSFEDTRQAGLSLGSGAVMVFDDRRDLRQVLVNVAHFFAHESCGKCYPCQLGTQRQLEILERQAAGEGLPGDRERLQDVGWTMTDASLCGLGQTAALAVISAMKNWPGLIDDQ